MHSNNPIIPYISLCSGYEGIGIGLHRCIPNLRCVAYCEREAFAIANLVAKMESGLLDAAPVFTDVTNFPWADYAPYMAGGILSFGWPCQPVSCAGKRKATEDERWLFDIIADGISILRPGMLFAENVEGLLSARMPDGSSVFGHCIERLESLHYKVEAGIFSAAEVGAPHQRKRVFILAYRNDAGWQAGWHHAISSQGWQPHELAACGSDQRGAEELADSLCQRGASGLSRSLAGHEGFAGIADDCGSEGCGELADAGSKRPREARGLQSFGSQDGTTGSGKIATAWPIQLADTGHIEPQGWGSASQGQQSGAGRVPRSQPAPCHDQVWPSRPGQQQYAWEPPRTTGKMENGSWLGRQISSQQSRKNAVQGEWGLERDDINNQGHGISECKLETRRKTEKSNDPHFGCDAVSWGKTERIGDQSYRREQIEQLRLESGICDSSREQPPCSNDGPKLHERRIQSNGEAQYRPSRGDTTINGIAVSNSEEYECMPTNHIVDSFWKKVEGFEARVMADTNDAGRKAGRDNPIPIQGRESHQPTSHCSNQARTMEDTICSGSEESEYINTGLSSEPSRSYPETMGDSSQQGFSGLGDEQSSSCSWKRGGHALRASQEVGDSECVRLQGWGEQRAMGEESCIPSREGREPSTSTQEPIDTGGGNDESEFSKIECEVGGDAYESSVGVGMPVMSSLCDSELEEIYEWMVKCENRTDELRLLGNGVVPATATKAFITLFNKLK